MQLTITKSERPHISFFGCTNSGKSSLVNAVTNQSLAVVSDVKGTTTDPVEKAMEILPLGPVVIIDTAGVNDSNNELGQLRIEKTKRVLDKTDIAVLVVDSTIGLQKEDENLIKEFKERKIPYVVVCNKSDLTPPPNPLPQGEGENVIPPTLNLSEKSERFCFSSAESQGVGGRAINQALSTQNNIQRAEGLYPPLEGGWKSLISGWGKNASHKFSKETQINAKELRNKATKQERILWKYLNKSQLGYKFRRQQPIDKYIVDFFCAELNLIIELDGGQHNRVQNIEYDNKRTDFLNQQGYRVLRIWNNDIDSNIEGVIEYIKMNLTPPPTPLPQGEGENVILPTPNLSEKSERFGFSSAESQGASEMICSKTTTMPQNFPQREGKNAHFLSVNLPIGEETIEYLPISAKTGEGVNELREKLGRIINDNKQEKYIIRDRLKQGDILVLVIPIDESAPKGRIILPQQNVLRECLDAHATAICTQVNELKNILKTITPRYVITDSQAFNEVKDIVPENIILTSFSILMAKYKGKLDELVSSAKVLSELKDGDKVLISEGCTHHRQCNDIGTVKFPKWISNYTGKNIDFEFTQGGEFPSDLSKYKLIIHCGGCMLNETEMKSRQQKAAEQNIPMVNYGMAIAYMNGILDRALEIFN